MNKTELWFKVISQKRDEYITRLVTSEEFAHFCDDILSDARSPLAGFTCKIACDPLPSGEFGRAGTGEPRSSQTVPLGNSGHSQCTITLWLKPDISITAQAGVIESCNYELSLLAATYWKPDMRDEKTRLPSLNLPLVKGLVNKTIVDILTQGSGLTLFYMDLDYFKRVNDQYGQGVGDELILHLSKLLSSAVGEKGIPLHEGGDEFALLLPVFHTDEAILTAWRIAQSARMEPFVENKSGDSISLSIAIGIASAKGQESPRSYDSLLKLAEKAIKPDSGKIRGGVRLHVAGEGVHSGINSEFSRNAALAVVKSHFLNERPFASPWLNALSQSAFELVRQCGVAYDNYRERCCDFIAWIKPELEGSILLGSFTEDRAGNACLICGTLDIALAVSHGVMRAHASGFQFVPANNRLEVLHSVDWSSVELRLAPANITLMEIAPGPQRTGIWDVGHFWALEPGASLEHVPSAIAVLLKIGHFELAMSQRAFSDVIVLDDRPTRGGGLPDFSYAAIARLITALKKNPNITVAYVLGDERHGVKTVEALRGVSNWSASAETMAVKTAMSPDSIRDASHRLDDHIVFCENEQILTVNLAEAVRNERTIRGRQETSESGPPAFLRRNLEMSGLCLMREDGCRVRTAAEAYPMVLEIARTAGDLPIIADQAGQGLRELVDFKVRLDDPTREPIPAFYLDEKEELDAYYTRVFTSDDALFGVPLRANGQLDCVLNHLSNVLSSLTSRYATRRAILVVPHVVPDSADVSPLGLVSIRILPRFEASGTFLHYSFTWRTVEVLIGFPYSLYGSIQFSQYLTEQLKSRVDERIHGQIKMGTLSYVAHSLHMFTDDYGQYIARKIVNDATT